MPPLITATPPEDGRKNNRPQSKRTTFIDAAVDELRKEPGVWKHLEGKPLPKGRARPYQDRGCEVIMRNTTSHTADIYVSWPKED
jgi:hypothetical protein